MKKLREMKKTGLLLLAIVMLLGLAPMMTLAELANDVTELGQPPIETGSPTRAAVVVPMDRTRTLDDIVAKSKQLPHSGFTAGKVTQFAETPSLAPPYAAGSLVQSDIDDALNALKMVRYLAGLPYEGMAFTPNLNSISQHGAVLLAASNQFSHTPTQPSDMPLDFFNIAYKGCNEANISSGGSTSSSNWGNISASVLGFIADGGANNLAVAGHRRWILKPGGQDYGIGYARFIDGSWYRYRINMYVFDGLGPWTCEADDYVAWPNSGDFPIQYFVNSSSIAGTPAFPWSINLGDIYAQPAKASVTLTLTRERDGKAWTFNQNTPTPDEVTDNGGMYFAVDNVGYGIIKALIFRPDTASLGPILEGDVFTVSITGIKTSAGADTALTYEIRFFDLAKENNRSRVNITVKDGEIPVADAEVIIDGQTLTTDENGLATLRVNNNGSYNYTVSKDGYTTATGSVSVGTDTVSAVIPLTSISATPILSASLSGFANPVAGQASYGAGALQTADAGYDVTSVVWTPNDATFAHDTTYTATVVLTAAAGYKFTTLTPSVNAGTASAGVISADAPENTLTFTVTFPTTSSAVIPVTDITGIPTEITVGANVVLNGTVVPSNATHQDIVWSVKNAGATLASITGNTLSVSDAGVLVITAVIADGLDVGLNFTRDFTITVQKIATPLKTAVINVTAPNTGETPDPVASGNGNFTAGSVTWMPGGSPFAFGTQYAATVTLTADSGYTFTGIMAANTSINGKKATIISNTGATLTLSYTFPATVNPNVQIAIKTAVINVTSPVAGFMPNPAAYGNGDYTVGPATWSPGESAFIYNAQYAATVTLTADNGFTFTGIIAANTMINGKKAAVVNNTGATLTLSCAFTATLPTTTD